MTKHIETKHKLNNICRISEFENLLADCNLSDEDKDILRLIYLKHKTISYIADMLGYSETTIKHKHENALKKLMNLM
jgi:DNA-directed RNA polymerase specialized sigma subunit